MKTLFVSIKNLSIVLFSVLTFALSNTANAQSDTETIKEIADATAQTLMRKVSPNTGYGAYAKVKDYSYNAYSKVLTIKIEAYWTAKRYMLASNYETFNIDGTLTIDLDDEDVDFRPTYKNSAVQYAWTSSDVLFAAALTSSLLSSN
jgi:hypothetical protein